MAKRVKEIMNSELLALRPADRPEDALGYLLALGISAAPVVDTDGKPIGYFSLRDALTRKGGATVGETMSAPVHSVSETAAIDAAARELSSANLHHAPVVTDEGRVIGIVSVVDLLKALLGMPVNHPSSFPHHDRATGLTWTDDLPLAVENADAAPAGPGVLVLIAGGRGRSEQVVWAEASNNVQARVYELASVPQLDTPLLAHIVERDHVRFRSASVTDHEKRRKALSALLEESRRWMIPQNAEVA